MTRAPHDYVAEIASAGAVLGSILQAVPTIAAVVGLVWYVLMIYESRTVQRLLHKDVPNE